jgi:hypothetical protein
VRREPRDSGATKKISVTADSTVQSIANRQLHLVPVRWTAGSQCATAYVLEAGLVGAVTVSNGANVTLAIVDNFGSKI